MAYQKINEEMKRTNVAETEDSKVYKVVMNHEEQYAIWPADRPNPLGWLDVGKSGIKAECLGYIEDVWDDMRPLSLRTQMEKAADLEQRRSGLPHLSKSKVNQPSIHWKDAPLDYSGALCVHDLFEVQAAQRPEAIAVVFGNQQLTYRELDVRANQLAHYLRKCGVGPEAVVGICVERSLEMVVGILGVLKAGGAYVPLDPDYPRERLAFILKDAQPSLLLTHRQVKTSLPAHGGSMIYLDSDWDRIATENEQNPRSNISAENLAYVMYTSGTTGKPKGVMITHKNLCHFVEMVRTMLEVTPKDVCLQTASITYALSVRQLMVPLCQGATVVIATSEQVREPLALFNLIKQRDVTMMDFVPSYWRTCVQTLRGLEARSRTDILHNKLRQIVCVGEPLLSDIPSEWTLGFKHRARLVNVFGQTESTGLVTVYSIPATDRASVKVVPIGWPVTNAHAYILASNMQPVPYGEAGELYISSPSLARGYLNCTELTVEKFVPNPFNREPGTRLYRTGDLACLGPDGKIEHLGRADEQVKIRGMRIELGEIEAALRNHPGVQDAAVAAHTDGPDERHLVGYLVSRRQPAPGISELRGFLKSKLPDYMVPSVFVLLEALPHTPNGKVDRRALPELAQALHKLTSDGDALETSLSKTLDIADWFYVPCWEQSVPPAALEQEDGTDRKLWWVVFVDSCGLGSQIVKRLEQQGQDVITVSAGMQFARLSDRAYTINSRQRDDYDTLLKELHGVDKFPDVIVHLWSVTPSDSLESGVECFESFQETGFYSLLFLAQALGNQETANSLKIGIVSNNMQEVTGEEIVHPEKATVLGPCKVIPQEYSTITCCSIDIELPKTGSRQEELLIHQIIREFAGKRPDRVVAYRGNYRWVQNFKRVRLARAAEETTRLRQAGVYLITGGLGGIGLTLAEYLARRVQAKLILVGRSAFPEREIWEHWLATHGKRDGVSSKIRKLEAIEELGAEVLVISADVSNQEQMTAVISQIYNRFGEVHGVIHAAGIAGGGMIQLKSPEIAADVLAPKVKGTLVLAKIFNNMKLDFIVLCSSVASILGRFGQMDYCAANAFLDAFAHHHTRNSTFTVSIDWDSWQDVGMAAKAAVPLDLEEFQKGLKEGILSREGMDVFSRIVDNGLSQVIVSTRNLYDRIGREDAFLPLGLPTEPAASDHYKPRARRLEIATSYVAPRTEDEQAIARIWQKVIGLDRISIHDNFFDLGGHSLSAARLCVQLQKELGRSITLSTFFRAPTIEGLARMLRQNGSSKYLPSIVALQTGGPRPPFFCVPVGQGSVHVELGEIARVLGQDQPFYGFQNLIDHPTRIEARAARYVEEIRNVQPVGPYLLGGICLGGVVAFEMAQQLVAQGAKVPLVALIEPGWPLDQSLQARLCFAASVACRIVTTSGRYLRGMLGRASLERKSYAHLLIKSLFNLWAFRRYIARRFQGDITLFLAETSLGESRGLYRVPWPELAAGSVQIHLIPGGRHEITRAAGYVPEESQLRVLARKLRICVDDALKTSAQGCEERTKV